MLTYKLDVMQSQEGEETKVKPKDIAQEKLCRPKMIRASILFIHLL